MTEFSYKNWYINFIVHTVSTKKICGIYKNYGEIPQHLHYLLKNSAHFTLCQHKSNLFTCSFMLLWFI